MITSSGERAVRRAARATRFDLGNRGRRGPHRLRFRPHSECRIGWVRGRHRTQVTRLCRRPGLLGLFGKRTPHRDIAPQRVGACR